MLGFVFVSGVAFASNLSERNVYGVLSDNFTGAMMNCGYDVDNLNYSTWSAWESWQVIGQNELGEDIYANVNAPTVDPVSDGTAKEGKKFWRFSCLPNSAAGSWSGFGFEFVAADGKTALENGLDISRFKKLSFWIRKVSGNITQLQIGVKANGNKVTSLSSVSGISNSSTEWQYVEIDLTNISTSNLSKTTMPLLVICDNLTENTVFDLDNVVLITDSSSAAFNITLKDVDDMKDDTDFPDNPDNNIIWKSSVFQNSWRAACQYVEINADKCDRYSYAWTLRLYTNNGASNRKGLWTQGTNQEYVIPMCFRVCNGRLYNLPGNPFGGDTYLIGYSQSNEKMYDRGKYPNSDPGWDYPWLWMREYSDLARDPNSNNILDSEIDSITIWDSKRGYHAQYPFLPEGSSVLSDGFNEFEKIDKTLRVYFGGNFNEAVGGTTFTANVVFELNYE